MNARGKIFRGALISQPWQGQSKVITFQYNPASMQRSLTPNTIGGDGQDSSLDIMYKGPPSQTINVSVEFDASDGLNVDAQTAVEYGVYDRIAALELLIAPSTAEILHEQQLLSQGKMEIAPMPAPTLYFVWGSNRVLPVKMTQYSVTEELFDANLNPVRATVQLAFSVLTCNDIAATNAAYQQYLNYQKTMERIAPLAKGDASDLNLIPSNTHKENAYASPISQVEGFVKNEAENALGSMAGSAVDSIASSALSEAGSALKSLL